MIVASSAALLALVAAAGLTLSVRRRLSAYLLFALALTWIFVNGGLEGPVLWVVSPGHGLTLADLLSPGCVVLSGWRLWTLRRSAAPLTAVGSTGAARQESASGAGSGR